MILRAVLADDEPLALERLTFTLRDVAGISVLALAHDGEEAARKIAEFRPDIVILDVDMPGRSGLAVAADLRGGDGPEVILISAFEHHAARAFDADVADYLLKPVRLERLRLAVERARRRLELRGAAGLARRLRGEISDLSHAPRSGRYDDVLWVPDSDGHAVRLPVAEIDWIEAARDYVLLQSGGRSYVLRATMGELAQRLDPNVIMRVHRSAFVRLGAVRALRRAGKNVRLVLVSGSEIAVGASYAQAVLHALNVLGGGQTAPGRRDPAAA